ncbi:hypothetical protein V8G54_025110 [Vigna mungo]|uniref:Uncharacterized protein n=1 Tax=Vigna mungo TaxID=3915 RepID=A0AAQ3N747_VIGMU
MKPNISSTLNQINHDERPYSFNHHRFTQPQNPTRESSSQSTIEASKTMKHSHQPHVNRSPKSQTKNLKSQNPTSHRHRKPNRKLKNPNCLIVICNHIKIDR